MSETANFLNGTYSNTTLKASLKITQSTVDGTLKGNFTLDGNSFGVSGNWHIVDNGANIVVSFMGLNPLNGQDSQEVAAAGYAKYDALATLYSITLGIYKASSTSINDSNGSFSPAAS